MSEPAWTPGPWLCSDDGDWGEVQISSRERDDANLIEIATVDVDRGTLTDEQYANADLIAASPELYDALTQLVAEFDKRATAFPTSTEGVIKVARAALAKARGEEIGE